jgi:predicted acylesterase/phospholipase RssA
MRAWRTGARFDTIEWARKASFFTLGSMTFKEAFERTGRILNISGACAFFFDPPSVVARLRRGLTNVCPPFPVIPYDTHSPTKLLNYLTAPDCVIYTAGERSITQYVPRLELWPNACLPSPVIASAAVPGILNPVVLLTKAKDGSVHPCARFRLSALRTSLILLATPRH